MRHLLLRGSFVLLIAGGAYTGAALHPFDSTELSVAEAQAVPVQATPTATATQISPSATAAGAPTPTPTAAPVSPTATSTTSVPLTPTPTVVPVTPPVPVGPLPRLAPTTDPPGAAIQTPIDSNGGQISSPDGRMTLQFPVGAIAAPLTIQITRRAELQDDLLALRRRENRWYLADDADRQAVHGPAH